MRQRRRWQLAAGVVGVMSLLGAGCGSDGDGTEGLADDLIEESGGTLDERQAGCVADALHSSFGDDSFQALRDAADGTGQDRADVRVEVIDIFATCNALGDTVLDDTVLDDTGGAPADGDG